MREDHYTVYRFMLSDLNLKGNELIVYAIIYELSQGQYCTCGIDYFAEFCDCTAIGVKKALASLETKGLIYSEEYTVNGALCVKYKARKEVERENEKNKEKEKSIKEKENKKEKEKGQENISLCNSLCNQQEVKETEFKIPPREEVIAYAMSKDVLYLADKFYEYYDDKMWFDRNGKRVKNWKLKFLYWIDRDKEKQEERKEKKTVRKVNVL